MSDPVEHLDLRSEDIAAAKRQELLRLFPEVRTEDGKIDFERLQRVLGETIDSGRERYGMNWPGKAECFRTIQAPSTGTLLPCPEESVNFDSAGNLIIEGDNLEVLKLLQKSYLGKVKLIYIDPPYNTGNDFIYPDNYTESLQTYLEFTGQVDATGKKFGTNTDTDGRFHSKWLNMMYPRLYLAANLLTDDGVILVSIDDAEVDNLRRVLNEVFGEENLVACLVWEKGRKNDAKLFSIGHEYMLVYAKSKTGLRERKSVWREEKPGTREIWDKYLQLRVAYGTNERAIERHLQEWYSSLPKNHPSKKWSRYKRVDANGPWRDRDISWPGGGGPNYDVLHPVTGLPCKVPERGWIYSSPEEMQRQIELGLVEFREDQTEPPFRKAHIRPIAAELEGEGEDDNFSDEHEEDELATQVRGSYFYKQSQVAVKYLRSLLGAKVFNNPKDHEELAKLFAYVTSGDPDATILDFFAGSGSSGEAVLSLNRQDGGRRKFILVQLPEPLDPAVKEHKSAIAFCDKLGKPRTIAEITKERIRRVQAKIEAGNIGKLDLDGTAKQNCGFRIFRLAESNFRLWDAGLPHNPTRLMEQLDLNIDHVRPLRTSQDILFELLLKSGYPLSTRVETLSLAGKTVFSVAGGTFLLCLERELTLPLIRAMAEMQPERVACLDQGFIGNDQLKVNASQIFETKGVISFKTV